MWKKIQVFAPFHYVCNEIGLMEFALQEWKWLCIYAPHNVSMILVNTLETVNMGSVVSKSWANNVLYLAAVT